MAERIQSGLSDQWRATLSSKRGWNNYVPNHWIKWATDNKLDLDTHEIRKSKQKKPKSTTLHGKAIKDIFTYKKRYVRNEFTKWYEKRALPSTHWTIMEYKSHFKRKRPDYAKSFNEKKDSHQKYRYKNSFLVPESFRTLDNWFIEREKLPKEKNQKRTVIAERVFDASGKIRSVTLLLFGMDVLIRQEDKTSKHKWSVSERREINIKEGPQQMINLKVPWSVHIRSVVQY
ncbi:MAG: hypothetical protein QY322_00105 [bacterium]|nr:MAG: hypothetical protein QY322_00105 [bacterium]